MSQRSKVNSLKIQTTMLAPDTVLQNRYLILRQLGQGGMGAVYQARDQRLGSVVILKKTLFSNAHLLKAFEGEACLLANLRHARLLLVSAQERGHDENARGAVLVTRPKTASGKPASSAKPTAGKTSAAKTAAPVPLGLGYTLYQKDASGNPVRVDAAREFHEGDAVRLMVEPNTNGYLYVFHAENGKDPQMIFPDARLNGGDNRITAHVPYEVPSRHEADPNFRWFKFDDKAATERLYVVVTRQPLSDVPTRKDLTSYCQANSQSCPWRPSETAWNQIAANANAPASVSQTVAIGQVQTTVEANAVSRGFGLSVSAPAPSVVKMNASPKAPMVMITVDLIHK